MNTDKGSQFTSLAWTDRLRGSGIRISLSHAYKHALLEQRMGSKGRFLGNIFVEPL
jgi:putative transposase